MLTLDLLHETSALLAGRDPDLARILSNYGPPPLWDRPAGFATLIYIILEQQVSLASARAAYLRLAAAITITPHSFLSLNAETLKAIGFSRQKIGYGRILAQAIIDKQIDLDHLTDLADDEVRTELTRVKGIGRWSADIYLLMALLRPDIWPANDLALAMAVRRLRNLDVTPKPVDMHALGEAYRPWRSVATRLFWHYYLSAPVRKSP